MKRIVLVIIGLTVLSGCSTTKGPSIVLENRVQALENRIQVLEADVQSSSVSGYSTDSFSAKSLSDASVETMTKKQIQQALKNAGYYDGSVDGKIGPRTKESIKEFQKSKGLVSDGVAGRKTKEKLLKYL